MATQEMKREAASVSTVGNVVFLILALTAIAVPAVCLSQRLRAVRSWKSLPLARWLILAIYIDSMLFTFLATIFFKGVGLDSRSMHMCNGAAILCLVCYCSTKFIYYFLVEKTYVVRLSMKPRMKDKLYLFNCFGVMVPYLVVIVLNFKFRFAYLDADEQCFLGIKKLALAPLISFEIVLNVYLTTLFVIPIRKIYRANKNNISIVLQTMALRAFIGSCATLTSTAVNLTVLMALDGEKGWICLTCCLADIIFTVSVLHWVTSVDQDNRSTPHDSNSSHTKPLCSPGQACAADPLWAGIPAWAEGPVDPSLRRGSWNPTQYIDRNQKASAMVNTKIATGSASQNNSIGLETLPGIKVQTEYKREVNAVENTGGTQRTND